VELVSVSGVQVLLNPHAVNGDVVLYELEGPTVYARFWLGGVYYQLNALQPLTVQDVTQMISSMAQSS
jgi:hypothetical protein